MSNQIFRITQFNPVGFLQKVYPTPYCSICRGFLVDVCETCQESHLIDCQVIEKDKSFYHKHCFDMISTDKKSNPSTEETKSSFIQEISDTDTDYTTSE